MVESFKAFVLHMIFWTSDQVLNRPSFRFDPTFKHTLTMMHWCSHTINIKQILFEFEFCLSAPSLGICPMFYRESPNPAVAAISMKFFDCFYHRLDMAAWCFKIYIIRLWILLFLFFRGKCKFILRSKMANLLSLYCDWQFLKSDQEVGNPPKMLILQQAGAGDVILKITDVRLPYELVGRLP